MTTSMRHLITIRELSRDNVTAIFQIATELKAKWQVGIREGVLPGRTLGLIFEKPSLRTRVSFETAMIHLGGGSLFLGEDAGFGKRESIADFARVLGIAKPGAPREIQVESAPLDVLDADLLTVTIPPGSRLHGVAVFELRLPPPAVITLLVRDGTTVVPGPETVLAVGDELLLVTTPKTRQATERRLRAVGRRGKLARWLGERGDPEQP